MKKIFILSSILLFSTGLSFAWISENDTNALDTLERQGYSESTLKIMDLVNYTNQGKNGDYQKVYSKKTSDSKIGRGYEKLKYYFDPIQDDQEFGQHEINFTNNWMGDKNMYTSKDGVIEERAEEETVEDL